MAKDWKLDREHVDLWAEWFKTHVPVCHVQELWKIGQSPEELKRFADKFYADFEGVFRRENKTKEDVKSALYRSLEKLTIYPFTKRRKYLLEDTLKEYYLIIQTFYGELYKHEAEPFETVINEDDEEEGELTDNPKIPIKKPDEVENEIIERMEPDLEKLREQGKSTREIAAVLKGQKGMSKSTIHRRLKKETTKN